MFAGCTQTVPKQRKTLKSQGFQGCLARNVNFDTMLPAVTFSVAGNIFFLGGNTSPGMVTGQSQMVTGVARW